MKAMVFAAGVGSRLKPWTDRHPKALVPVHGCPMLGRVIDNIIAAGIHDIVVNVHHFASQVTDFLATAHFDADITISDETDCLLDTGGGLAKALPCLCDEPVLIHNADILTDLPLMQLVHAYEASHADALLLVQQRDTARHLVFGHGGCLKGWENSATGLTKPAALQIVPGDVAMAFNGVHVMSPALYGPLAAYAPAGTPFSIIDFYLARCPQAAIMPFVMPAGMAWHDLGKPEALQAALNDTRFIWK